MQRVSINGITAEHIAVNDRGLQYSDGLFETIACVEGKLQFWDDHIDRMNAGAQLLSIDAPSKSTLLDDIDKLIDNKHGKFVVKILLTRGYGNSSGDRGYKHPAVQKPNRIVMISDWPVHADTKTDAHLCFCKHPVSSNPKLSGLKHLGRLDNVIARNEWKDEFHEGLMSDINGNIIEGTMSNVFGIRDGQLYTPLLDESGVNGVIRSHIIEIAKQINIPVLISRLSKNDIYNMDEVFITNSIIGIWPVSTINDANFKPGKSIDIFCDELHKRIEAHAQYIS